LRVFASVLSESLDKTLRNRTGIRSYCNKFIFLRASLEEEKECSLHIFNTNVPERRRITKQITKHAAKYSPGRPCSRETEDGPISVAVYVQPEKIYR